MQLKYCRNIFVEYYKIFHRNITILTFWHIFENKWVFNTFIIEILKYPFIEIHIFILFSNGASDDESLFFVVLSIYKILFKIF